MSQSSFSVRQDIVVTRIIDAPVELVWRAWTDPEYVKRWWGPQGYNSPFCKIDLREGGNFVFAMQALKSKEVRFPSLVPQKNHRRAP